MSAWRTAARSVLLWLLALWGLSRTERTTRMDGALLPLPLLLLGLERVALRPGLQGLSWRPRKGEALILPRLRDGMGAAEGTCEVLSCSAK